MLRPRTVVKIETVEFSKFSMNIFFLSAKPGRCARWHCDKHVVKMILESTQILYTCQHMNGGTEKVVAEAPICVSTGKRGYKNHAANHPSVIWARSSMPHYIWLCWLALALVKEHMHRFKPKKIHSCNEHLVWLLNNPPPELIGKNTWLSDPTPAMPDEYKISTNSELCYRAYYLGEKGRMLKWTGRHTPHVFIQNQVQN